MTKLDLEDIYDNLKDFSDDATNIRLTAQAHARNILNSRNVPDADLPDFDENLDEKLLIVSQNMIWKSLQLVEDPKYQNEAKKYMSKGAEILEFLYKDNIREGNQGIEEIFKAAMAYYISGYYARSFVLMKQIPDDLPNYLKLISSIFKKDFKTARHITIDAYRDPKYVDENLKYDLEEGQIGK